MQGFNMGRYVPPDQEGLISSNKLAGKHPLGSRARNLHKTGELTVRFEMPFSIWCSTCQPADTVLIGQGVRFNAVKKKVGNYYSTPIYSFRMKHTACGGWIEIRTDPKNTAYIVTEGARRRDTGEFGEGQYVDESGATTEIKMRGERAGEVDPFAKLEGKIEDENRFLTAKTHMEELVKRQDRDWEDPYEKSRKLRRTFRAERKSRELAHNANEALKDKMSLGIELLDESEADRVRAGLVDFNHTSHHTSRPLFGSNPAMAPSKDRGKQGKTRSAKAADIAAQRKAMLRQELSGNTRAAIDPFLSDEKVWQPGIKRRKAASADVPSTPNDNDKDKDHDDDDDDRNERNDNHENGDSETAPSSDIGRRNHTPALVDYGSSDTD